MSDGVNLDLEDRLREHYRHLQEHPSADKPGGHQPVFLATAACLIVALALGAAYLGVQNANRGQPLRTAPGVTAPDGSEELTDPSATPAIEVTTPPTSELDGQVTTETSESGQNETGDDQNREDALGTAESEPQADRTINVDGSPIAPEPGTVPPPPDAELGAAYGIWEPGRSDTCSKEIHDSYWVYGPDGKVYPTFHPPIHPADGCTFGHEHGRDPADSDLSDIPFPFGYVEELAAETGQVAETEDHVGHKIEWYNDGGYYQSGSPNSNHDQICDVAYKLHMGSHSDEAFANNAHEVFHYARCTNGSELIYRAMHRFGSPGEFNLHCDQGAGETVAIERREEQTDRLTGGREIPGSACFEDQVLVPEGQRSNWRPFDERWTLYHSVDSAEFGRFFIQFFFFVDLPSRYWDGQQLARTVDLCYRTGALQVRADEYCEPMRAANGQAPVEWDDPASPFNGADRSIFMGDLRLDNNASQNDWYTDIHGGVWATTPFPDSIRQHVATAPIDAAASYRPDPIRSITFQQNLGIHAPN